MGDITNVKIKALHVNKTINFECANLDVTQQFKPNWSTEKAYGKMDPIANFSSVDRTAKFKMVLLANQLAVAKQLQTKIGRFIQFNYPQYASKGGVLHLKSPPFFKISCLQNKLYTELKGYITDLNIIPGSDQLVVPLVDDKGRFFERRYDIDFGFQVLHSHVVGYVGEAFNSNGSGFVFYGDVSTPPTAPNKPEAAVKIEDMVEAAKKEGQDIASGFATMWEGTKDAFGGVAASISDVATSMGASSEDTVESVKNYTAPPVNQSSIDGEGE